MRKLSAWCVAWFSAHLIAIERQTGKLWIKYKHLNYFSRRIINVQYNINVASDSDKKECPEVGIIAYIRDGKTLILSLPDMLMLLWSCDGPCDHNQT